MLWFPEFNKKSISRNKAPMTYVRLKSALYTIELTVKTKRHNHDI